MEIPQYHENQTKVEAQAQKLAGFLDSVSKTAYRLSGGDLEIIQKALETNPDEQNQELLQQASRILDVSKDGLTSDIVFKSLDNAKIKFSFAHYHFHQSTDFTCAVACFIMGTSIYLPKLRPSQKAEADIFQKLIKPGFYQPEITDLIKYATSLGLFATIYSENNYKQYKPDDDFGKRIRKHYLSFLSQSENNPFLENNPGVEIRPELIKNILWNGEVILINGTVGSTPHMRLISGYKKNKFIISDPLKFSKSLCDFDEIQEFSKAPYGRFMFSISTKPRELLDYGK